MLINAKNLHGLKIHAIDGELGTVDQFYFDDETWAVRYLVVNTASWLAERQVLISPISIVGQPDWQAKQVNVALTRKQVENSPDIDTHQPVSRQHEIAYFGYYGYPYYWGDSNLWGPALYPAALANPAPAAVPVRPNAGQSSADSHLRSSSEVKGYSVAAADGEIGHVDGFIVDFDNWAIRYIEVATRNWWPGKKVLVSPTWIERVSWEDSAVYAGLSRQAIQNAPPYEESMPITREYEQRLYLHYGRPSYWLPETDHNATLPL